MKEMDDPMIVFFDEHSKGKPDNIGRSTIIFA